jgi:site-specific DNA-methyltransferase (cytosine-N4-specific)
MEFLNRILQGHALDVLRTLPSESVDMCLTSPPYYSQRWYQTEPIIWDGNRACANHDFQARTYSLHSGRGDAQKSAKYSEQAHIPDLQMSDATCKRCGAWRGELGLEPTVELYIEHLAQIFDEVKRLLKPTGTCWIVIGDKYAGSGGAGGDYNPGGIREGQPRYGRCVPSGIPFKSICFAPYLLGIEMTKRGWIARQILCWHKPNRMPENVIDRYTVDWEPMLFFSKNRKYYFHKEKDRRRSVWSINTKGQSDRHYAAFPEELCKIPIQAACPPDTGVVLDPFAGRGTVGIAALKLARNFIGIDLNPEYVELAKKNLAPLMEQQILTGFFK